MRNRKRIWKKLVPKKNILLKKIEFLSVFDGFLDCFGSIDLERKKPINLCQLKKLWS